MAAIMAMPAELIARRLHVESAAKYKVLDIAAGHGMFGIAVARQNPNATIHAVDWPVVLDVARENAAKANVGSRRHALPGSAFDVDFGNGYDLALVTNFFHHFDPPTCEKLLKKIHGSLAPNGRVAILEFVPNPDRVSPPQAAMFPLIMLTMTPAGDAYTFAEYQSMLRNGGFKSPELHDLPPTFFRLIVAQP